jgi:hypothetical protein
MATRIIDSEIWRSDEFYNLTKLAKILCFYVLSSQYVKLIRVYALSDREICSTLGIDIAALPDLKTELKTMDIEFYKGYVFVFSRFGIYKYRGGALDIAMERQKAELPEEVLNQFIALSTTSSNTLPSP